MLFNMSAQLLEIIAAKMQRKHSVTTPIIDTYTDTYVCTMYSVVSASYKQQTRVVSVKIVDINNIKQGSSYT